MAYNMSYTSINVPTFTINSIGGIIPGAYSATTDLLPHLDVSGDYYATTTIFDVSLNPGAYIFTSSIVIYSGVGIINSLLFNTGLYMDGSTNLSSGTNRIFTNEAELIGSIGNCFAFNVANPSSISFLVGFQPNNYSTTTASATGSWSLMRIG